MDGSPGSGRNIRSSVEGGNGDLFAQLRALGDEVRARIRSSSKAIDASAATRRESAEVSRGARDSIDTAQVFLLVKGMANLRDHPENVLLILKTSGKDLVLGLLDEDIRAKAEIGVNQIKPYLRYLTKSEIRKHITSLIEAGFLQEEERAQYYSVVDSL